MNDLEYREHELRRLGPTDEQDEYRVKFTSDEGETRWLSLTPEQFRRVGMLLTSEDF